MTNDSLKPTDTSTMDEVEVTPGDGEAAIAPIRRASSAQPPGPGRQRRRIPTAAAIGFVLLALLIGVFFVLPRFVATPDERAAAVADAVVQEAAEADTGPQLSDEEIAELRASAEDLLAELLELNSELEARSASAWGGDDWITYNELSKDADAAFLDDDFVAANTLYSQALALGHGLIADSDGVMAAALDAGDEAIAAGNPELAKEQFGIVLTVDPDNARALAGLARAERLPEVLELMRQADRLRQDGDLEAARDAYRSVLEIDPEWGPAARSLPEVRTAIANSRFDRRLSAGFAAIARQDYRAAESEFEAALALKSDSAAARDGLNQAQQGQTLDAIALAEVRALAFERRELWDQAIAQYQAALETDPTLEFAIDGLERAQARADLDRKLQNLIENPRLLLDDELLADARLVLSDAGGVDEPGERITAQIERLNVLIRAASTPVAVRLTSDELTEVTVYRVGSLGVFRETQIEVRPGTYTVVGSRSGYRDVRQTITILPGREVDPVNVVCVEPI